MHDFGYFTDGGGGGGYGGVVNNELVNTTPRQFLPRDLADNVGSGGQ